MDEGFWMVYGLGQGQPTVRHKTHDSAKDEARRLAAKHPGIEFFVMAAIGVAKKIDVEYRELNADYAPF